MRVRNSFAAAGLAILAAALLQACGGKAEESPETKVKATAQAQAAQKAGKPVNVALVEPRTLAGGVVASGILISREEAAVNAEVTGFRVSRVLADVGDRVGAGQTLVQLDDTLLRAQIDQQTAAVAQADVASRQALAQAERVKGLDGQGVIADEQIEQRRFQAETARAQLQAARASLNDLKTRQGKMAVRSPVAGIVLERQVRPGDLSGTGAGPMFRLARDGVIELEAQLAESALAQIRPGQAVTVTLPSQVVVQGVVRLVEPNVDPQTKQGRVRVRLPANSQLRAGGFGRAEFSSAGAAILAVPEAALRYDADGVSLMIVGADNKVRESPVSTGRRGGGYVEIVSGAAAGDRVLLGSGSFVLEGDLVRPILAKAAPAAPPPPKAAPAKSPPAKSGGG